MQHCETCKHFERYVRPYTDSIIPEGDCQLFTKHGSELAYIDISGYGCDGVSFTVNEKFGCVLHEEKTDAN